MRHILTLATIALMATPAFAQAQSSGPATQSEGHQASGAFGNAGDNLADAARNTWHGVKHGWEATKEGTQAGWNKATQDHDAEETPNATR